MQATALPARCVEFEAANRHRVPFTAISGGLFIGKRARPIPTYPHIPEANARIARLTGAHFGDAYQRCGSEKPESAMRWQLAERWL